MNNYNTCSAELGSVTIAMKAQSVLSKYAIPSNVIKNEGNHVHGCVYGLSFDCVQKVNVQNLLDAAGIKVKNWSLQD